MSGKEAAGNPEQKNDSKFSGAEGGEGEDEQDEDHMQSMGKNLANPDIIFDR